MEHFAVGKCTERYMIGGTWLEGIPLALHLVERFFTFTLSVKEEKSITHYC